MITGYGEKVKPYLIATLTGLGATVREDVVMKTAEALWETPELRVEMLPDTYDELNRATCHARISAVLECADKDQALERSNNLLALIARQIIFNVEWGLPKVAGHKPYWFPPAVIRGSRPATEVMDPHNIALTWECDFRTALGGI